MTFNQSAIGTCAARYWLLGTAYILVFGSLFCKTYRVAKIFHNEECKTIELPNSTLLMWVGALASVQWVLLLLWTAIDAPTNKLVEEELPGEEGETIQYYTCQSDNRDMEIVFGTLILVYDVSIVSHGNQSLTISRPL